jgi:hypothetical protein
MKKLLTAGFLLIGMAAAFAASTVNPNIPTPGSALSSAPIRANFAATYNDITALQARFPVTAADGGFGGDISAQSGVPLFASGVPTFTGTTGTGSFARAASPTFSGTTVIGSGSVLNTPASLTLTNATGLQLSGITGMGSNVASWLAAPSSANLLAAVTDETGTGSLVFNNVPVFIAPVLGAATGNSLALNACTLGSNALCATGTANISGATTVGSLIAGTPILSASGGTNNGFFAVTGPASTTKTFTFPNATATVLTTNAAVTAAQGGTGQVTYTVGDLLYASGTTALSKLPAGTLNYILTSGGPGVAPTWTAPGASVTQTTGTCSPLPTFGGTGSNPSTTYTSRTCNWVKTGKTVTTTGSMVITSSSGGSGSFVLVDGLSDTPIANNGACSIGYLGHGGLSGGATQANLGINSGSKNLSLWGMNYTAGTTTNISVSNANGFTQLDYSCTYQIP